MSDESRSSYQYFKSSIALQQVVVGVEEEKVWKFYDAGPKKVATPLLCLHGVAGAADNFYKLIQSLCPKGYRIISVQYPPYYSHLEWVQGFELFLNAIRVDRAHIFGCSLGGFLAQCFAQHRPSRVDSLILSNSFCDTDHFNNSATCVAGLRYLPEFYVKRIVLKNLPTGRLEAEIANSIDHVVRSFEALSQSEVASRLTLTSVTSELDLLTLESTKITIIECLDEVAIPEHVRQELYKRYPYARTAFLRTGGNFPYLSRADEVDIHIMVHLRACGFWPQGDNQPSVPQTTVSSTPTEQSPVVQETKTVPTPAPVKLTASDPLFVEEVSVRPPVSTASITSKPAASSVTVPKAEKAVVHAPAPVLAEPEQVVAAVVAPQSVVEEAPVIAVEEPVVSVPDVPVAATTTTTAAGKGGKKKRGKQSQQQPAESSVAEPVPSVSVMEEKPRVSHAPVRAVPSSYQSSLDKYSAVDDL